MNHCERMNVGNDFVADVFLSNEFVPNELVFQNKFFTTQCAADEILDENATIRMNHSFCCGLSRTSS